MAGRAARDAAQPPERRTPKSRGERTRRRIAEATLTLLEERETPPTAQDIATRAGVSHRLIFHHFEDLDALHRTVRAVYADRYSELAPSVPADLPLDQRVERTARRRATLYESIGNLGRNSMALAPSHPAVAAGIEATHRLLLGYLERTFGPELQAAGPRRRAELLGALDTAVSWQVWDRLRKVNGLPVAPSRRIMTRMLRAVVTEAVDAG